MRKSKPGASSSDYRNLRVRDAMLPVRAGNYTALMRGTDGATGVALVETFDWNR